MNTTDCKRATCYNETNRASGYCADCENRQREDAQHTVRPCTSCGRRIDILETYSRGECLSCHARRVDNEPLQDAGSIADDWRNTVRV